MRPKTKRAKGGRNSSKRKAGGEVSAPQGPPELSPLDYALRIMRDEAQPAALRASMAKAALPYLHPRCTGAPEPDDTPDETPRMSDLELARRIAFILTTAQA